MEEVLAQTSCQVSLSTEGSIIPFTPGDVYLCGSGDSQDIWCLVVLHKRNFPRKYNIQKQLTKLTIRRRGVKTAFVVIEFDDTNQVRLKDFSTEPVLFTQVLEFCQKHRDTADLADRIKEAGFNTTDMRPKGGGGGSEGVHPQILPQNPSPPEKPEKQPRNRRSQDNCCVTTPSRFIASIEETRVINEARVEEILVCGFKPGTSAKRPITITNSKPSLSISSQPLQDPIDVCSSSGSTPPREFVVSELEPNICGAEYTISSNSPDKKHKLQPMVRTDRYSTFNFPSTSPPQPGQGSGDVITSGATITVGTGGGGAGVAVGGSGRRSKRRLTSALKGSSPPLKERRRMLSDNASSGLGPFPAASSSVQGLPCKRSIVRARLRSTPTSPSSRPAAFSLARRCASSGDMGRSTMTKQPHPYGLHKPTVDHHQEGGFPGVYRGPEKAGPLGYVTGRNPVYYTTIKRSSVVPRRVTPPAEPLKPTRPHQLLNRINPSKQFGYSFFRGPLTINRVRNSTLEREVEVGTTAASHSATQRQTEPPPPPAVEEEDEDDSEGAVPGETEEERKRRQEELCASWINGHHPAPKVSPPPSADTPPPSTDTPPPSTTADPPGYSGLGSAVLPKEEEEEEEDEERLEESVRKFSEENSLDTIISELSSEGFPTDFLTAASSFPTPPGLEEVGPTELLSGTPGLLEDGAVQIPTPPASEGTATSPGEELSLEGPPRDLLDMIPDPVEVEGEEGEAERRSVRLRQQQEVQQQEEEVEAEVKEEEGLAPPADGASEGTVKVKTEKRRKSDADMITLGTPKPHGFVNLGNTCYMNCVLQCVLTVPSFRKVLLLHDPPIPFVPTLFNCLAALFRLKLNGSKSKQTRDLLVKVKNLISSATSLFKGSRQQDAHEFLGKFLDVLREEGSRSLKCPVSRTFQCEVIHTLRCERCRAGGQKTEKYYDFSLNLPPRQKQPHSLVDLLDSYFNTDMVELKCSVCGHNTAQVQHRFSRLPQALVLHVQRYAFSRNGSREGKRQDAVSIPSRLDITKLSKDAKDGTVPRVSEPEGPVTGHNLRTRGLYSLHAVISHLGESRECGHYICDVYEGSQWYYYDDVNMHLVDLPYIRAKRKTTCYLFFYLREDSPHAALED